MKNFVLLLTLLCVVSEGAHRKKNFLHPKHRAPASYSNESTILENITRIENLRLSHDPYLLSQLSHPSVRVVKASLLALARIGDPYAIDDLQKLLNRKNPEVQKYAAFALGMIGNEIAVKILEQQIQFQKNPEVTAELLINIGRAGKEKSLPVLTKMLETSTDPTLLNGACEGLGLLFVSSSDKWSLSEKLLPKLVELAVTQESTSLNCAFALSRYKGDPTQIPTDKILLAIDKVSLPDARSFLVKTLSKTKKAEVFQWLMQTSLQEKNTGVRVEAIRGLKNAPVSPELLKTFKQLLKEGNSFVLLTALETAGAVHGQLSLQEETAGLLLKTPPSYPIRRQALILLSKINFSFAKKIALEVLKYPSANLYGAALISIANGTSEEMDSLIPFFEKSSTKALTELFDALLGFPPEKFSYAFKQQLKKMISKHDVGLTSQIALLAEQFKWKDFGEDLANSYKNFPGSDLVEVKISILNALNALEDKSLASYAEPALNDSEKSVVVAAVQTIKTLTGRDESARIPLNSKVTANLPSQAELQSDVKSTVILSTSKGEIHLKMLAETPVTAYHFVKFIKENFYKGKHFHRVIANFVAQGGDPRGDGYGGPGFLLRDEVSPRKHLTGTVGMATAGKDTGGCQFFFNTAPNLHLTGRYTLFAEVTKGLDVVLKLENGDQIF